MKFNQTNLYSLMQQSKSKYINLSNKYSDLIVIKDYFKHYKKWVGNTNNVIGWYELEKCVCIGLTKDNQFPIFKYPKQKSIESITTKLYKTKYFKSLSEVDKLIFESHYIINELLNPYNSYPYIKATKNRFEFMAKNDIKYFVTIVYQPTKNHHFEFKFGWYDDDIPRYDKSDATEFIDQQRSDTIANIWKNEILPFFKNQNLCDTIKLFPLGKDIKRYLFGLKMVTKFKTNWINIIEDKPKCITITKI